MALPEHEEAFVSMIRDVLEPLITSGKATAEVEPSEGPRPTIIVVRPSNPDACPVTVQLDFEQQVTLYFGRYGTTCEMYDDNRARLLDDVRLFVEAVLAGKYRERVRLRDRELGRAKAWLETRDGTHRFSYSRVGTLGRRGPWQELSYEPY